MSTVSFIHHVSCCDGFAGTSSCDCDIEFKHRPHLPTRLHAQKHLVPEPGSLAEYDEYHFKVREVFGAAQAEEVICRVVILGSTLFLEQEVGVRKTAKGHEVFSIDSSSVIWDTELLRMHESGQIQAFKDGKKLTLEEDESYQELKKRTPADFRKITTEVKVATVDEALARRIAAIWERMLLATRHPKEPRQGLDGASYHFSMFVLGRGIISGQIWSPAQRTKTAALVDLAYTLSLFAMVRLTSKRSRKLSAMLRSSPRPSLLHGADNLRSHGFCKGGNRASLVRRSSCGR